METHSKTPSLKWGFASCPSQPHPAAHRTQLCHQLGLFKSLFSVFALQELEPGVPACPGKLHAKASAGAECQPSPGHGHSPTALKVRRSSAPFSISSFSSHTLHSQIPLSAARNSRLTNPWCNHPELFPWELSCVPLSQTLSILGSSSHPRQSWKWAQEGRAWLAMSTHR